MNDIFFVDRGQYFDDVFEETVLVRKQRCLLNNNARIVIDLLVSVSLMQN